METRENRKILFGGDADLLSAGTDGIVIDDPTSLNDYYILGSGAGILKFNQGEDFNEDNLLDLGASQNKSYKDFDFSNKDLTSVNTATITTANITTANIGTENITGDFSVDTDTFKVDSSTDRIGMGTSTPSTKLHITDTSTHTVRLDNDTYGTNINYNSNGEVDFHNFSNDGNKAFNFRNSGGFSMLILNDSGEVDISNGNLDMNINDIFNADNITANNLTGTLQTAAQPNITSTGTLTSLNITGDLTVNTNTLDVDTTNNTVGIGIAADTTNKLTVNGDIKVNGTDKGIIGNTNSSMIIEAQGNNNDEGLILRNNNGGVGTIGSQIEITENNFISFDTNAVERMRLTNTGLGMSTDIDMGTNDIINATSITATNLNGTLQTSVQPNITSTGTLTSLTMGGGIDMGTNNITNATSITATNLTGILQTAAQPNITSTGTLTSLTMGGNLDLGTNNINNGGTITATNFTGTLQTASQPNITSVGTLTGLIMSGDIDMGNNNVNNINTFSATNLGGTLTTATQPNITSLGTQAANLNMGTNNINNVNTITGDTGTLIINDDLTVNGDLTFNGGQQNIFGNTNTGFTIESGGNNNEEGLVLQNNAGGVGTIQAQIDINQAQYIKFSTAETERARIDLNGHFGIGTSTPSTLLDINESTTNTAAEVQIGSASITANDTDNTNIKFMSNGTEAAGIYSSTTDFNNNYGKINFNTRGTEGYNTAMSIDDTGFISLGHTEPSFPIHMKSAGGEFIAYVESETDNAVLAIDSNSGGTGTGIDRESRVVFREQGANEATIGYNPDEGGFKISMGSNILDNNSFIVLDSGNVGLGLNNPSERLEVQGNIQLNGDLTGTANNTMIISAQGNNNEEGLMLKNNNGVIDTAQIDINEGQYITFDTNAVERMRIDNTAIDIVSGDLTLTGGGDIIGIDNGSLTITAQGDNSNEGLILKNNDGTKDTAQIDINEAEYITFDTNTVERMRIDNDGVDISNGDLAVSGDISATGSVSGVQEILLKRHTTEQDIPDGDNEGVLFTLTDYNTMNNISITNTIGTPGNDDNGTYIAFNSGSEGIYSITYNICYDSNSSGYRKAWVEVYPNGYPNAPANVFALTTVQSSATDNGLTGTYLLQITTALISSGIEFVIRTNQNSGGTRDLNDTVGIGCDSQLSVYKISNL